MFVHVIVLKIYLVKLNWLRIDDSIRVRKLYMIHKTINGECPENFDKYVNLLKIRTRAQNHLV